MGKHLWWLPLVEIIPECLLCIEFEHLQPVNDAMSPADPCRTFFLPHESEIAKYRETYKFMFLQFLVNHHDQTNIDPCNSFRIDITRLLREEAVKALITQ